MILMTERPDPIYARSMSRYLKKDPKTWKELGSGRSVVPSFDILSQRVAIRLYNRQGQTFIKGPKTPLDNFSSDEQLVEVYIKFKIKFFYVIKIHDHIYACDMSHIVEEINSEISSSRWKERSDK
jgi:hypothetical protein